MYDYSIFSSVYDKPSKANISSKFTCPIRSFAIHLFLIHTRPEKLDGYLAPPPPRPQSGREIPAVDSISYFSDLHKKIVPKETPTELERAKSPCLQELSPRDRLKKRLIYLGNTRNGGVPRRFCRYCKPEEDSINGYRP
jgi:hypothetical protein